MQPYEPFVTTVTKDNLRNYSDRLPAALVPLIASGELVAFIDAEMEFTCAIKPSDNKDIERWAVFLNRAR